MAKEPYMPLFFGDFLAATVFWRGEERGLYLLLLGYEWTTGPLPTDTESLATATGYEQKHFDRLWKRVGPKFKRTTAGLVNDKLERVRAKSREIAAKNAANGKKGADAKWRNSGERHADGDGESMATAIDSPVNGNGERHGTAIDSPMAKGMATGNGIQSNPIQGKRKISKGESS